MISIICPLYNEKSEINKFLLQFKDIKHNFEVICVDGGSSDNTVKLVENQVNTTNYPLSIYKKQAESRAASMNRGARHAKGEILWFLHVDSRVNQKHFNAITDVLKTDSCIQAGAFNIRFNSKKRYFRGIETFSNLRAYFFDMYHGDQALFITKKLFDCIGGYENIPLMEDVSMSQLLKCTTKTKLLYPPVLASPRRIESNGFLKMVFWYFYMKTMYRITNNAEYVARLYRKLKSK